MDIIDVIKSRRSVRKYSGEPLSEAEKKVIEDAIAAARSPFGGRAEIHLLSTDSDSTFKPSTYGVITGARDYLTLSVADDRESYITGAFMMESVVLAATKAGLGTCWLGGTFKSSTFGDADSGRGLKLVAVVPVGRPAASGGLVNRIMRAVAKSDARKALGEMFFVNNFDTPLPPDGPYIRELDMMRLAPSSRNCQPWRGLIRGNQIDFYCVTTSPMNMLDMGIGLYHFDVAACTLGVKGMFAANGMPVPMDGCTYIISFIQA